MEELSSPLMVVSKRPIPPRDSGGTIPDDLIWDILKWLPAKSLMRFKCMSKFWLSIITDPSFAKAHRGGFRGLFISQTKKRSLVPKISFYHVSLDGDTSELCHHLTVDHGNKRMRCTGVVNGLVCFYYCNHSYLYNIATGESMQLPLSTHGNLDCHYYFGFDSDNKLYKLLKIYPFYYTTAEGVEYYPDYANYPRTKYSSLILTIGVDSLWRDIGCPPTEIEYGSVCFHGVLYWLEPVLGGYNEQLVTFDLAREKFLSLPPNLDWRFYLPRFAPCLSLITFTFGPEPEGDNRAWILTDGNGGIGRESRWTWDCETEFKLLSCFRPNPFLMGILPDWKVLIVDETPNKSYPAFIYLHDPYFHEHKKILLHVTPSPSSILKEGDIFYYEENIMPLRSLIPTT